jgi:hypothetical protein
MPDASRKQLERFLENAWETPFGFMEGDLGVLKRIYSGYGDMVSYFAVVEFVLIASSIVCMVTHCVCI